MAFSPVFLDTFAILALIDKKDRWHDAATAISEELEAQKRPLVVTEWVLTEFLNATAKAPYRRLAVQVKPCRSHFP
jgi:predicted nucleic acid-binding protein